MLLLEELTGEIRYSAIELLTYLQLSQKRVGLLFNYNVPLMKDGIIRRVL